MDSKEARKMRDNRRNDQRLSQGLCIVCGEHSIVSGKKKCMECLAKLRASAYRFADRNLKLGYCLCNKNNPVVIGKTRCRQCLKAANERAKSRWLQKKEQGICYLCEENVISGRNYCQIHIDKMIEYRKQKRLLRKQQGVCERCGHHEVVVSPDRPNSVVCKKCLLMQMSLGALKTVKRWIELETLFNKQKTCPYTKKELTLGVDASLDHILPRSRGGADEIDNLQFVYCAGAFDVNRMKGEMTHEEFLDAIQILAKSER